MLIIRDGNIFFSPCKALVNPVNCVGVMGKGLALDFKSRYPDMFLEYQEKCSNGELRPGILHFWESDNGEIVVNFPTKKHWRGNSRMRYVETGLDYFLANYEAQGIESIAFPALGCGNGGLSWNAVEKLMIKKLSNLPIEIEIYRPEKGQREYISHT